MPFILLFTHSKVNWISLHAVIVIDSYISGYIHYVGTKVWGGGKKEKKGEYIHFYFTDNKNKNGFVVDISQFLTYSMFTDPGYEIIETTF